MEHLKIASDNYVAFTFFIGTMAMMAASVFFFFELNNTAQKWRTSVLVSGLITFIAAIHYYYMRSYNLETGDSPTFFRYVDWILTVPLMCVEFYLITKKGRCKNFTPLEINFCILSNVGYRLFWRNGRSRS